MPVYRPPQFNLTCRVWHNALPAELASWDGLTPDRPADVAAACQLYVPRSGYGRGFHAISDDAKRTFQGSGFQELRLPRGTPVRTVWGVTPGTDWRDASLVEVPEGSGRLYVAILVENKHTGFPNEYVVAILAQLRRYTATGRAALGLAAASAVVATSNESTGTAGLASEARVIPAAAGGGLPFDPDGPWIPWPDGGLALWAAGLAGSAKVSAAKTDAEGAAGLAGSAKVSAAKTDAEGAAGLAAEGSASPVQVTGNATAGLAATATSSSALPTLTGGANCAAATAASLPLLGNVTVPVSGQRWFAIPVVGAIYHVRVTLVSGTGGGLTVYTGASCAGQTTIGSVSTTGTTARQWAMSTGNIYLQCTNGTGGSVTYTVDCDAGTL